MNKFRHVGVETAEELQKGSLVEVTRSGNYGKRCMRGKTSYRDIEDYVKMSTTADALYDDIKPNIQW
jgi:hypothetical protein